jgi:hypothetical protein
MLTGAALSSLETWNEWLGDATAPTHIGRFGAGQSKFNSDELVPNL